VSAGAARPIARVVSKIAAPGHGNVAVGFGSLWVTGGSGKLFRLDPTKHRVVGTIALGATDVSGPYVGEHGVWLSDPAADAVIRIDPTTNRVVARITAGTNPLGIADAFGAIWVANEHGGSVSRIDPATNRVAATIALAPAGQNGPLAVVAASGAIWVTVPSRDQVLRIDPKTNAVIAKVLVNHQCGLVAAAAAIWVGGGCGGTRISRIDPRTSRVTATRELTAALAGDDLGGLHRGFSSLWCVSFGGSLLRVDPQSLKLKGKLPLAGYDTEGESLDVGFGSIWIRVAGKVLQLRP